MRCTRQLTKDITWIGASDRKTTLFENIYPVPRGVSYNSYVVKDEKTVLLDTVDSSVRKQFLENLEYTLEGRPLDYIIVNHMEPDHSETLVEVMKIYPQAKVVANKKTVDMFKNFSTTPIDDRLVVVAEGDTLCTGFHTFAFVLAPMVHWPEVMVTYDTTDKVLFSADAFGSFGALNGNIFADELDFERDWLDDARRYYTNIVGKYGPQVVGLLHKASGLDIEIVAPLHGPVWRENLGWFIDKYMTWGSYGVEEKGVLIAYGSIYGNTENAANILASELAECGVRNVTVYDASSTDVSYIVSDCFKFSHIVLGSITYNLEMFTSMEQLLHEIQTHNLQNRTFGFIENGTWAITSGKKMYSKLEKLKNSTFIEEKITIKSSLKAEQYAEIQAMAKRIAADIVQV